MTSIEIQNISDLQKLVDTVREVTSLARKIEITIKEMSIKITLKK